MKYSRKSFTALFLILAMMTLPLAGCSSDGSSPTETSANQLYYDSLAANNFTGHTTAQPPADFFATVKHFDLVAANDVVAASATLASSYAVYQPASAGARGVKTSALANALPGEGIPGFKGQDMIPLDCQGLPEEALKLCLEGLDEQVFSTTPAHASHFDSGALSALFGESFANALVDKVIASKLAHVDAGTRDTIAAQLTDYINDAPAHATLDLARHNIFDRSGYNLTGATFTDNSRGDIDGDGDLDQHSTLQLQISKQIDYTRSGHSELDRVLQQYLGFIPAETYQINLQVFIHLNSLRQLRQAPHPSFSAPDLTPTLEEERAQLEQEWAAAWINKALDANILQKIVENPQLIPWASSEYMLSLQVAPDQVTQNLGPALAAAAEAGDASAHALLEQHMNAQTAIVTGGSSLVSPMGIRGDGTRLKIFYQVNQHRGVSPLATASRSNYAMLDERGRRVAIYDSASGVLVLAEEENKFPGGSGTVQPAWTKDGACKGNKGHWAYWPSRVQTGNFGRGINWILTESLLHNQVGDYKNIHWYQSGWKSAAQVAIKSGMWVVKNYLQVQFAGADVPPKKSDYALYYLMEVLAPYMADYLGNGKGTGGRFFKIAGYGFEIPKKIPDFWRKTSSAPKDQTLAQKIGNKALSFLIDRVTDGVGQSLDVTVTGWQDYSDGSHYGCFAFSY